jgi:hypothetical protein
MQQRPWGTGGGARMRGHGAEEDAVEGPLRGNPIPITAADIARAARELVAAYGPDAATLMQRRMRAVRRRGDAESATLWCAVAEAVEEQLAVRGGRGVAADQTGACTGGAPGLRHPNH